MNLKFFNNKIGKKHGMYKFRYQAVNEDVKHETAADVMISASGALCFLNSNGQVFKAHQGWYFCELIEEVI